MIITFDILTTLLIRRRLVQRVYFDTEPRKCSTFLQMNEYLFEKLLHHLIGYRCDCHRVEILLSSRRCFLPFSAFNGLLMWSMISLKIWILLVFVMLKYLLLFDEKHWSLIQQRDREITLFHILHLSRYNNCFAIDQSTNSRN